MQMQLVELCFFSLWLAGSWCWSQEHLEHSVLEGTPSRRLLLARTQMGLSEHRKKTENSVGIVNANSGTFNSFKHLPVSGKAGKCNSVILNSGTS